MDLQQWLIEEGVREELDALARKTALAEFGDAIALSEHAAPQEVDWPRLLLAGSILARSEQRQHQEAALRIATGAITLSDRVDVADAGAILLSKMSNFRAISLACERSLVMQGLAERLGVVQRIEMQRREVGHTVLVESSGVWLSANEFQRRFWENASRKDWVSASAPTASGKTFLVLQWLVDQVLSTEQRIAIYLAPTRALVAEIEAYLKVMIGDTDVQVLSLPLRAKFEAIEKSGKRAIFVLTQERLHMLVNLLDERASIDLLIVDEAHKIGDSQRGVILQDALERVVRFNPRIKVVLISPATQNPGLLLDDAPEDVSKATLISDIPTVLQNVIFAEQAPRLPKVWQMAMRHGDAVLPLGSLTVSSSPGGRRKKLAFIAVAAGHQGGTLIYAHGAADAEEIADLIGQIAQGPADRAAELSALADLARKGVHPQFKLASLVERGVAFHYGNMPSLLRQEIENLFRSGAIRFLVCTSTLIEGVNLSCRTIVLRGPRKGKGRPMDAHDFWNLAGRAGRWGNEFQGNIICVDPGNKAAWPEGVPARSRYPIKRETDAAIGDGIDLIRYLELRLVAPTIDLRRAERYEHVAAYLISTYLRLGSLSSAPFARRHSVDTITEIERRVEAIAAQVEISVETASRHPGVSALGMQRLLDHFRAYEGNVENLLPAPADSQDSYDRFVTIMRRVNQFLYPAFMPETLIPLHAQIVVQWLKGYSLASMISKNIQYHRKTGRRFSLPSLIRSTMELVEQIARFKAPKYLSAYVEVLNIHLRDIGREDLVENGADLGVQLEFGVSTRTLLSLMELGLSRMSAVALYEKIAMDNLTPEECIAWVSERREVFDDIDIPEVIRREVLAAVR